MSSGPGGRQNRYQAHQEATNMADETVSATTIIHAPAEAIFAVLADPARHAAIDGTGWVRQSLDSKPLTAAGPSKTKVTLSYDWSAVPDFLREHIGFPPFPPDHLGNSLAHLAELATA